MSENLKRSPDTLEDLKFVLKAIADIKDMSLTVEMRIADIQERYRTIAMYNIAITDEEREACANIQQIWEDLFLESKYVDASLIVVKKKFTEVSPNKFDVTYAWFTALNNVYSGKSFQLTQRVESLCPSVT